MQKPQTQSVIPECFEDIDCAVPVKEKYCGVDYYCIQSQCYVEDIKCPEICSTGFEDEDLDGKIDCEDPDCWYTIHCTCETADYNACREQRCLCETGQPRWVVENNDGKCRCIEV